VEPATGRLVSLLVGGLNSDWFGLFLAHVAAAYPGERLVVVLDNAGWHVSQRVVVPDGITLWFQPPHSPEVNVMEQVWQWVRGQHTRGALLTSDEELDGVLCDALDRLMNDPAQVRSLTNQPWLYASASA
jgi:transposase